MSNFNDVSYLNSIWGNSKGDKENPDWSIAESQLQLIAEEFFELHQAIEEKNITEVRDAIADVLVTCYGMAHRLGIDADSDMAEVHKSNLSKLCLTQEEVTQTLKHYADQCISVYAPTQDLPVAVRVTYSHTVDGKLYPKAKILKSINWREPKFE